MQVQLVTFDIIWKIICSRVTIYVLNHNTDMCQTSHYQQLYIN